MLYHRELFFMHAYRKDTFFKLFLFVSFISYPSFLYSQIETITLFTGSEQGTYYAVGNTIKEILEGKIPGLRVLCGPSNGSIDNARLMELKKADLAIIQNDIAYHFTTGTRIFSLPSDKMKLICPLYSEVVHIVTNKDSGISVIRDLKDKIVSVGARRSGTEFNARVVLDTSNITYQDVVPVYEYAVPSIELLKEGRIDVFFATTRVPASYFVKPFEKLDFRLISFQPEALERITKAYPYFMSKRIEANSYANQYEEISTVGVRALLVASSTLKPKLIVQITKKLFENKDFLEEKHPFINLDAQKTVVTMGITLHAGAKKYFTSIGVLKRNLFRFYFQIVIIVFLVALLSTILIKKFPEETEIFLKNVYVKFILFFTFVIFFGSAGLYFSERNINENFTSVSKSFWSCVVYIFSGFEDRVPISSSGKLISIVIFLLGVSIFGIISGRFASYFVETALKKENIMPRNIKEHLVICNWNNRAIDVIKELYNADSHLEITILTDIEIKDTKELYKKEEFKRVHLATGDPAFHDRLETCKVYEALSVIILANEMSQDPDAQSALIALAISKVCKEHKKEHPHIVAEALNHRKVYHLYDAGVNEVVCAVDYGMGLLSQSALHPGLTKVYDKLLSYSGDTNELYIIRTKDVPSAIKGKTFAEASEIINKNRDEKNPAILIGLMRDGEPTLNPKKGNDEIKDSDNLIVLSYTTPDFTHLK